MTHSHEHRESQLPTCSRDPSVLAQVIGVWIMILIERVGNTCTATSLRVSRVFFFFRLRCILAAVLQEIIIDSIKRSDPKPHRAVWLTQGPPPVLFTVI